MFTIPFDRPMKVRYFIGMPNGEPPRTAVLQGTLDLTVLQTPRALRDRMVGTMHTLLRGDA